MDERKAMISESVRHLISCFAESDHFIGGYHEKY